MGFHWSNSKSSYEERKVNVVHTTVRPAYLGYFTHLISIGAGQQLPDNGKSFEVKVIFSDRSAFDLLKEVESVVLEYK